MNFSPESPPVNPVRSPVVPVPGPVTYQLTSGLCSVAVQVKRGLSEPHLVDFYCAVKLQKRWKMSGSKIDFVNDITKSNKVAVFSKVYCPYCTMAKSALKEVGLKEYFLMELDEVDDGPAIQDALQKVTGARTVGFYLGHAARKTLFLFRLYP